jgi:hypothetical protein
VTIPIRVLSPTALRTSPQVASLHMLEEAIQTVIIALCAAHPDIERQRTDQLLPLDERADSVVDAAMSALEAIDHYRTLLHDLEGLQLGMPNDEHDDDIQF